MNPYYFSDFLRAHFYQQRNHKYKLKERVVVKYE